MKTVYLVGCVKRDVMRWVGRYSEGKGHDLSNWYCGITHVDNNVKVEQLLETKGINNLYFRRWLANDATAANEIVSFFLRNGMKTKPPKGKPIEGSKFVFVFRAQQDVVDEILSLMY